MILVFSGTSEGNEVVKKLLSKEISTVVSCTTDVGKDSIESLKLLYPDLIVSRKELDADDITGMIRKYNVRCIIDATHPFAVRISANAMDAAGRENIKYIRFERKEVSEKKSKNIVYVDSFEEAVESISERDINVFLTTGVRNLDSFSEIIRDKNRNTYIKILPTRESIDLCLRAGAEVRQIIAYYGKWGVRFMASFIKEKSINVIVAKQSGISGGELDKINAVKKLNCRLVIIRRPRLKYPDVCFNINNLMKKVIRYI